MHILTQGKYTVATIVIAIGFIAFFAIPQAKAQVLLQISNLEVETKTDENVVVITWETNLPAEGRVDFGLDDTYGTFFRTAGTLETRHTMMLWGLDSETTYHFKITSATVNQSISTFDRTFKTKKFIDRELPIIDNVKIIYITGQSATIQWETDEPTTSHVRVGKTAKYSATRGSGARTTLHDVTLKGLRIATTYHFQVVSRDKDGNTAVSNDRTFQTLLNGEADKVPFKIEAIRPLTPNDPQITPTSVTISWRTNKPASTVVSYGRGSRLSKTIRPKVFQDFFHSVTVRELEPGTDYSFKLSSADVFGKKQISDTMSFVTRSISQPLARVDGRFQEPIIFGFTTLDITRPSALYSVVGSRDIFAIVNGQKYRVTGPTSLRHYGAFGIQTRQVSQNVLRSIPDVRLVKAADEQTVYFLTRRENKVIKLALPTPSIFVSYPRNTWDDIVTVDIRDIAMYEDVQLMKAVDDPRVYFLENNLKHWITSEDAFKRHNYDFSNVVEVTKLHLDHYRTGSQIN